MLQSLPTDYTYAEEIEITAGENGTVAEIEVYLHCTERSSPPTGPSYYSGGNPGWGPEFDALGFGIRNTVEKTKLVSVPYSVLVAILGPEIMAELMARADQAAADSGEF